eukprot:5760581-Prymnesium_polylepis.1
MSALTIASSAPKSTARSLRFFAPVSSPRHTFWIATNAISCMPGSVRCSFIATMTASSAPPPTVASRRRGLSPAHRWISTAHACCCSAAIPGCARIALASAAAPPA